MPWQSPKSEREDIEAPARVTAILNSKGYLQADEDVGFLQSDHMRGVRLHLDFSKAEHELAEHDVTHTIVVFGSTRIPEPIAAHERHQKALDMRRDQPDDPAAQEEVSISERILARSTYYTTAQEFGGRSRK